MKRTVWTFGLISGCILSVMMLLTIPFMDRIGFDRGMVIGYTTMVLAFLLVYFGVRSYRDNVAGGTVGFGRAFTVGSLIVLIASTCYVATWQVIYHRIGPDFLANMQAHMVEKTRASGASPEAVQQKIAEMQAFAEMYQNPFINAAITFLEPLPVGLVFALVTAGVLSRARRGEASEASGVVAAGAVASGGFR
jgi:hypothetical protein